PGILLPGLILEDLSQGISKIRNRVIARIFRVLNLIEQWGSGFPRIFDEAKKLKLQTPELKEIGTQIRFIVYLTDTGKKAEVESRAELGAESRAESRAESGAESEMAQRILNQLAGGELSKKDMAGLFGKENPSGHLNKLIRNLVADGTIEYTIPEKPNSRLQKYRLTINGRKQVEKK
ncbi:AAA family ATPase, partial [bacterium]|nr:AAA family ATPase [bacterium]